MRIRDELAQHSPAGDSAVTIGVFDGVHLGHRRLIGKLIREAASTGRISVVLTFKNHPTTVLRQSAQRPLLMDLDDRIDALKQLGVDIVGQAERFAAS